MPITTDWYTVTEISEYASGRNLLHFAAMNNQLSVLNYLAFFSMTKDTGGFDIKLGGQNPQNIATYSRQGSKKNGGPPKLEEENDDTKINNTELDFKQHNTLFLLRLNINSFDRRGLSPLHLATRNGSVGVCTFLLKHGADPNIHTREFQDTPLHMLSCLDFGSALDLTRLLLLYTADVGEINREGFTPLEVVYRSHNLKVIIAM